MPEFHETIYGRRFFDGQLPDLIRNLGRIADAMEKKESDVKKKIIAALREYIDKDEADVESGIDEGIYDKEENVENLASMKALRELCDQFEKM